jgi:lipid II:glycine glycyltransferase (peptidoglycan interpeptide bridge formation enzyme)
MTEIKIIEFNSDNQEEWENFIRTSHNGTIFHELLFLGYHNKKYTEYENHLMFYYKKKLLAVIPMVICDNIIKSPYGSTYGGFVHITNIPFSYVVKIFEEFNKYVKEKKIKEIYIRPPPFHYHNYPNEYFDYILGNNGYKIINQDILSVICLHNFNDPISKYSKNCRWAIRKSLNSNITIKEDVDYVDVFYNILLHIYKKYKKKPTHTLKELTDLKNRYPKRIRINLAYFNDEPIAGICQFICNNNVNLHFYNAHFEEYKKLYPINLLLYNEIEFSIKNGFKYFDLGTSTNNSTWNEGIFNFKEGFRSSGILRKTYFKNCMYLAHEIDSPIFGALSAK